MAIYTMNAGEWYDRAAARAESANYLVATPTTGQTVAVPNNVTDVNIIPAGPLLALTVNFPTAPYDGQNLIISTTQNITNLTLVAVTGVIQSIAVTINLGATVEYKYLGRGRNIWMRKR